MEQSRKGKLNKTDWGKIAKGAGLGVAGALLTVAAELLPGVDLGIYGPFVTSGVMVLLNIVRKANAQPKK